MITRPRRLAAAAIAFGALTGSAVTLALGNGVSPTAAALPKPSPICTARGQIPDWLWHVLVQVLDLRCPPRRPTTTTRSTGPTTATEPTTPSTDTVPVTTGPTTRTTTRPVVSHITRITVTSALVTCTGTPAARGDCGPPVPTKGKIRMSDYGGLIDTDANGQYVSSVAAGGTDPTVQAVFPTPPARILDCPTYPTSTFGLSYAVTAICYSFPAP
jgi:hypothetical protein